MRTTSKSTAVLAIASLLIGNVAGWLHVGHHCHADAHPVVSQKVEADEHSCGCHHHDHGDEEAEEAHDEHGVPPIDHDHDSDSCSICQNFLVSRQALPTLATAVVSQPRDAIDTCSIVSEIAAETLFLSGHWSRGPPRA